MKFVLDKDIYKVARVAGGEHNFLGLRFKEGVQKIDVINLSLKSGECHTIDQKMVLSQVIEGLGEVNAELGSNYAISEIFLVPSDSPSNSVYKFLTIELIKRIERKEKFVIV